MKNSPSQDLIDFICFKLIGKTPTEKEKKILLVFFECFYDFSEDSIEPPSSMVALLTASCGMKYSQVLSNTLNCFGEKHFCFEDMAEAILKDFDGYKIAPGFGHPKYKKVDPRTEQCISSIKSEKYEGKYTNRIIEFSKTFKSVLNIGGLFTAFLLDLGFNVKNISYLPIIARIIGVTKIYQKSDNVKFDNAYDTIYKFNHPDSY
jgi:hypothetical protein